MDAPPHLRPVLAGLVVVLALLPGLACWWRSRPIRADDPALPERLMALRRSEAPIAVVCLVAAVAAGTRWAWWSVPLLFLARAAAAWPLRRRVFGETWSLPVYLAWSLRVVAALWGFWLLLMVAPLVIAAAGGASLPVGALLAVVLAAWHRAQVPSLLWWLGARAWDEAAWPSGFRRVLDGARLGSLPRVWRTGPPGSSLANALALPALRESHVLFTDPLVDRLDAEELSGVLAHEVSHLELFTPALLRRWNLVTWGLIVSSLLVAPLVHRLPTGVPWAPFFIWPALVFVVLGSRGRVIRAQETPSDRRAIELCGNAEALVSGLVKLHETGKLPRRWAAEHEKRASHPSLARRIRAIREAAGQAAPAVTFPLVVRGTNPTAIVIEADRVRHLSGVPTGATTVEQIVAGARTTVAVPWAEVAELRVDVPRSGTPTLVLGLATGEKWGVELDAAAVPTVQRLLDSVDDRLPAAPPVAATGGPWPRIALAVLAALAVVSLRWSSALLPIALALLVPGPGPMLASAIASVASAALAIGDAPTDSMSFATATSLVLAPAAWVAWLAWRWRRSGTRADTVAHVGIGIGVVALWTAAIAWSRADVFELHVFAGTARGIAVLPLALAAAWAWSGDPRLRRVAVAPLALALAGLVLATTSFVDVVVRDPLSVRGPRFAVTRVALEPIASATVGGDPAEVWFSPSGRTFAVAEDAEDDDGEAVAPRAFTIGDFAGRRAVVQAQAVTFAGDDTLVTLEREGDGLAVRARPVAAPATAGWSVSLPVAGWGLLTLDGGGRRWRVEVALGSGVRRFDGTVGEAGVAESSWTPERVPGTAYVQWIASDARPLGRLYDYQPLGSLAALASSWLGLPTRMPVVLRLGGGREIHSRFDGSCHPGAPGVPVVCLARDGARTHVWTWNGRSLEPVGRLDDDLGVQGRRANGWLVGWSRGRLALVSPDGARAYAVRGACTPARCVSEPVFDGQVLGGLVLEPGRTSVATYRLRPVSPPAR